MSQAAPAAGGAAKGGGGGSRTCFKCGKSGHWSRDCSAPREEWVAQQPMGAGTTPKATGKTGGNADDDAEDAAGPSASKPKLTAGGKPSTRKPKFTVSTALESPDQTFCIYCSRPALIKPSALLLHLLLLLFLLPLLFPHVFYILPSHIHSSTHPLHSIVDARRPWTTCWAPTASRTWPT